MSIIARIGARFARTAPELVTAPQTTIQEMPEPPGDIRRVLQFFEGVKSRRALVETCRSMFDSDTRVRRVVTDFAADIVGGGFAVTVQGNTKAQDLADQLIKRVNMISRLDDWLRLTMVDGDSFLEVGVDAADSIALITRKPTLEMRRSSDRFDLFPDPAAAYHWTGNSPLASASLSEIPPDSIPFAAWQIIHARWDHTEGRRYGFPLYGAATQPFKYVQEGEKNMAIARKLRSGMRIAHKVPGTPEDVRKYMELNKDKTGDDYAAFAEYFGNVDITAIQGQGTMNQFEDVMHHVRTLSFASPLTLALLGYGQDLNRDVLQEQQKQYEDQVSQVRVWTAADVVKPMIELQWLLAGIYAPDVQYDLVWSDKKRLNLAQIKEAVEVGLNMLQLGFDLGDIQQFLGRYVPEIAELLKAAGIAAGAPAESRAKGIAAALDRLEL